MKKQSFVILAVMFTMLSCGFFPAQVTSEPPTLTPQPGSIETIIVKTVQAAATMTQRSLPTETATPIPDEVDNTPTEFVGTPTSTATFFFVLPTSTNTTPTAFATPVPLGGVVESDLGLCTILSQGPPLKKPLAPGQDFDARWEVQNLSSYVWDKTYDLAYVSGADMSKIKVFDFPKTVAYEEKITLIVDMFAPKQAGLHTAVWTIKGPSYRCNLTVTVRVEE